LKLNCGGFGYSLINRVYGITRDPQTQEYAIVTEFYGNGNLRQAIGKDYDELSWSKIIQILSHGSCGLDIIHSRNYLHKDLHSGNILTKKRSTGYFESAICDFGLSSCGNLERSGVYGVLPFVAPEVLRGEEYTNAPHISGLRMIMFEMFAGEPPFVDQDYHMYLPQDLNNGMRAKITDDGPQPYVDLIKHCWD